MTDDVKERFVLLTRPLAQSEEMADKVRARGFTPLINPMLEIEHLEPPEFGNDPYDAFIFTSANAVRALDEPVQDIQKPIFCVGERCAALLKERGFSTIRTAQDVKELIDLLKESDISSFLYMRGAHVRNDLKATLPDKKIEEHICYRAVQRHDICENTLDKLERGDVAYVVFMSARTGEAFVDALKGRERTSGAKLTKALCLSTEVLESVSVLPWKDALVSQAPDADHILALLV